LEDVKLGKEIKCSNTKSTAAIFFPNLPFALFVGLAYKGKDIVFRFIIEYGSLRDFGP
jgi:hypothetical protein